MDDVDEGKEWAKKIIYRCERLMSKADDRSWREVLRVVLENEYAFNHPTHADPNEPAIVIVYPQHLLKDKDDEK